MRTFSLGLAAALTLGTASLATSYCGENDKKGSQPDDIVIIKASSAVPPGMVAIPGGRTLIGSKPKAVEELLQNQSYHGYARTLDGETPQWRADVKAFTIGKYEITNEQYLRFVKASGHQPPEHWGQAAVFAAQTEHGRIEAEKAKAAKERGETYKRIKWTDQLKEQWWAENWSSSDWAVPEGLDNCPVVFVDYTDARDYAEWAGMRLPTEEEWIRAARADKDQWFPWGDEWEAKGRAHTTELGRTKLFPVGSFPNGASPYGAFDMAGSVWEWTTSPYSSYPKYKTNKFKVKKTGSRKGNTLEPTPVWDSNQRVVKSGAFQFGLLASRVTTRRATDRNQTADGLGFRIATSAQPGRDVAETLWRTTIKNSPLRDGGESFDFDAVIGLDRWTTFDEQGKRAEGYGVVDGYEHIIFVPRFELDEAPGGELNRASRVSPVLFGYLSTSIPFAEPALPAGDYIVAYREKGTLLANADEVVEEEAPVEDEGEGGGEEGGDEPEADAEDEIPLDLLTPEQRMFRQINLKEHLLIFIDATTGEYVDSILTKKATGVKDKKSTPMGVSIERIKVWVGLLAADKVQEEHDWMTIDAKVRRSAKSRVIPIQLRLRFQNDTIGTGWRR